MKSILWSNYQQSAWSLFEVNFVVQLPTVWMKSVWSQFCGPTTNRLYEVNFVVQVPTVCMKSILWSNYQPSSFESWELNDAK